MHAISYSVLSNVLDDLYVEWFKLSIACESIRSVTLSLSLSLLFIALDKFIIKEINWIILYLSLGKIAYANK
jgi:hypothetical protein